MRLCVLKFSGSNFSQASIRRDLGTLKRSQLASAKRPKLLTKAKYPVLDRALRANIIKRRKGGFSVHRIYMRRAALRLYSSLGLPKEDNFIASNGFLTRFCRRNRFVIRRVKNKKIKSAEDRIPDCETYLNSARSTIMTRPPGRLSSSFHPILSTGSAEWHEEFGWFDLPFRCNTDQIPGAFIMESKTTYEVKGSKVLISLSF